MITQNQAKVAVILENMRLKKIVTISLLVAFFIILVFLLLMMAGVIPSAWESQAILGAVESILGYTMYPLVKHFFPSFISAKESEDNNNV
jgi:hypothetical protein